MADTKELSSFIESINHGHEKKLRAYIEWKNPSLSKSDIDDVYQETMSDMVKRWRRRPDTRDDRHVGGLLKKIADRKVCTLIRKRVAGQKVICDSEATGYREAPAALYGDPAVRDELRELIVEAVKQGTADEQRVWTAYAENYPESEMYTRLAAFAEMQGQPRRAARLLESMRARIIKHLKLKGYTLD
jgi:DNA-directed RNA polymerase specialized sigma24 family protein